MLIRTALFAVSIVLLLISVYCSASAPAALRYKDQRCRFSPLVNGEELELEFVVVDTDLNPVQVDDIEVSVRSLQPSSFRLLGPTTTVTINGSAMFLVYVVGDLKGPHWFEVYASGQYSGLDLLSEVCSVESLTPGNPVSLDLIPQDQEVAQMLRFPPHVIWAAVQQEETVAFKIVGSDLFGNSAVFNMATLEDQSRCPDGEPGCVIFSGDQVEENRFRVDLDEKMVYVTMPKPQDDIPEYLSGTLMLMNNYDNEHFNAIFSLFFDTLSHDNFPSCYRPECLFWHFEGCEPESLVETLPQVLPSNVAAQIEEAITMEHSPVILFKIEEQISGFTAEIAIAEDPFYFNIGQTLVEISSFKTINYTHVIEIEFRWCQGIDELLFYDAVYSFKDYIQQNLPLFSSYRHLCFSDDVKVAKVLPTVFQQDEYVECCDTTGFCTSRAQVSIAAWLLFIFHLVASLLAGLYVAVTLFLALYKSDFVEKSISRQGFGVKAYFWLGSIYILLPAVLLTYSIVSFLFSSGSKIMIAEAIVAIVTACMWWLTMPVIVSWIYWKGTCRIPKMFGAGILAVVVGETVFILVVFALWSTVGLIINPLRVLPFFAAVISVIGWMARFITQTSTVISTMEGYARQMALKRYNFDLNDLTATEIELLITKGSIGALAEVLKEMEPIVSVEARELILADVELFRKRGKTALAVGALSFGFWLVLTSIFLCLAVLSFSKLSLLQSLVASAMQSLSGLIASGIDSLVNAQKSLYSLRDNTLAGAIGQAIKNRRAKAQQVALETYNEAQTDDSV